jgi:hypothetical protein
MVAMGRFERFCFSLGDFTSQSLPRRSLQSVVFVPWLDKMVQRVPPLVSKPQAEMPSSISTSYRQRGPIGNGDRDIDCRDCEWLSHGPLGTRDVGGLLAHAQAGPILALNDRVLGLGFVTRFSGTEAALGLAFAQTGVMYPMFGTFLGPQLYQSRKWCISAPVPEINMPFVAIEMSRRP